MGDLTTWLLMIALGAVVGLGFEVAQLRRYCNSLNDRLNALGSRALGQPVTICSRIFPTFY